MSAETAAPCWTDAATHPTGDQHQHLLQLPGDAVRLTAPLTLRGGATVTVRPIRPDDTERLRAFHAHLSLETIYLRFFTMLKELPLEMAERLTHVDYEHRMALVATVATVATSGVGGDEQIIAVVRYERAGPTVGEVAFVVADDWQGRGIATALLHRLAVYARRRGFVRLVAHTMGWNTRMHSLLRRCGYPAVSCRTGGLSVVMLDISRSPEPAYAP